MSLVPFLPESAPFTAEQRAYLNGFFAGLFSRDPVNPLATRAVALSPATLTPLTILFGSQTGTAESLAKRAAKEAGRRGFAATALDMAQADAGRLASEKNLLVIVSTFGDGEPPDSAKALHAALGAPAGPEAASSWANLRYAVCALGDTNYTQFCKCGQDFDGFFEKRGAVRVLPRIECDLDFEAKFTAWLDQAIQALASSDPVPRAPAAGGTEPSEPAARTATELKGPRYNRQNPFPAPILMTRLLNGPGSGKQVHHVAFALGESDLTYEAGDALGVYPQNCPELVAEILTSLGCDGEEAVPSTDGGMVPLRRALHEFYDLGKPSPELWALSGAGARSISAGSSAGAIGTPDPSRFHVLDVLLAHPGLKVDAVDFVRALKKLQPRLYSISSSPRGHPGEVHLTVGAVRYDLGGRPRKGACSTFLAERVQPGEARVGIFVHPNRNFRPPVAGETAMIMVGPGTGIAPFRAFLHERRATAARGKNWLFFGDQRAATDFLYQEELVQLRADGILTRLDTAFSRDQAKKTYVQHRMLEQAAELYAWLEAGAHFYVCGDAARMAKDVDAALQQVVIRAGKKSPQAARDYVQALQTAKRYARDVY